MRRAWLLLFTIVVLIFVFIAPAPGCAQQWSGIIDPSRAVDWSSAGVAGGVPNATSICSTLGTAGQLPAFVQSVTAAQINTAIASAGCSGGTLANPKVVFLNAGTYQNLGGIDFTGHSYVVLRGAGADRTLLKFTGTVSCNGGYGAPIDICIDSTDNSFSGGPSNTANWTAGYTKGATQVTLSNSTNLSVGAVLILDQVDDAADTGNLFVCQDNKIIPPCSLEGNGGNGQRTNRDQSQIVKVVSCSPSCNNAGSTVVTITPGLYMPNWRSGQSPGAWWASNPAFGNAVENMSIDHTGTSGAKGILIQNALNCWIKGIRSIDSGKSHVGIANSARISVVDSYFYLTQNSVSQSYGTEILDASDVLVQNNIFQYVAAPYIIDGSCSGCVMAYNFSINDFYTAAAGYVLAASNQHVGGIDMLLNEGNIGDQIYGDVFHGTHNFVTIFRNQFTGNEPACWQSGSYPAAAFGACSNAQNAIILNSYSRFYNVIGNVLGQAGIHTIYSANSSGSIYDLGAGNTEGAVTVLPDSLVAATLMRWGNYDTVNNAVRFVTAEVPNLIANFPNPTPISQALPNSFYLNAKPSWFGSVPWPPIGPDVTGGNIPNVAGHANMIPAMVCYSNVMGGPADGTGNVLSFNANNCYGSGSPPPPPPTNLKAVVN